METHEILERLDAGDFDALIGEPETAEVDFKRDPYRVDDDPGQAFELAKDVSARKHRLPTTIPTPTQICLLLDHSCFARQRDRSICATSATGGAGHPAPSGVTLKDPKATSAAERFIPSHTSRIAMPSHSRSGPESRYPPRPSGSTPRAAGSNGATFTWGDEFAPRGRMMANTWQGEFPWQNLCTDGYEGTSPVERFPPNGYGLYDMAGNVWEWTSDSFEQTTVRACCAPHDDNRDRFPRKVIKGGSHLCAPNYCLRYRPAARQTESIDTSTCHIGFRCVVR
jgi:hypothetical protein